MPLELQKLGTQMGMLYIQLASFPSHYLVLVITAEDFRYALISTKVRPGTAIAELIMGDIGWLDVSRIHGEGIVISHRVGTAAQVPEPASQDVGTSRGTSRSVNTSRLSALGTYLRQVPARDASAQRALRLLLVSLYSRVQHIDTDTQVLSARVAYTKVEQQFKSRGIPYTHVNPSLGAGIVAALTHIHSSLARAIPALCVQSSDILSGAPAAEAAMPNIRVIPLNWWTDQKVQVRIAIVPTCATEADGAVVCRRW